MNGWFILLLSSVLTGVFFATDLFLPLRLLCGATTSFRSSWSHARFTHVPCPACAERLYPDVQERTQERKDEK